jgi:hypothetical protein
VILVVDVHVHPKTIFVLVDEYLELF